MRRRGEKNVRKRIKKETGRKSKHSETFRNIQTLNIQKEEKSDLTKLTSCSGLSFFYRLFIIITMYW